MKKVLILTVIAILALGVFALANTAATWGTRGEDTQSATCSEETLTVTSHIGIEQGYFATATSYDASFCGATGNPLTDHYTDDGNGDVLLAELFVASNGSTIAINPSYSPTTLPSGMVISYRAKGSSTWTSGVLTLGDGAFDGAPYSGSLQAYVSTPPSVWDAPDSITITFSFDIVPMANY